MSSQLFLRRIIAFNLAVIVFTIFLGWWKTGNPSRYFGEGRYPTFLSAAQLLAIGGLAWQIFTARKRQTALAGERRPCSSGPTMSGC